MSGDQFMKGKSGMFFDHNATVYDAARPDYLDQIYDRIMQYIPEGRRQNLLEVGAGNGVASRQIVAKLNPQKLTLVEPGHNFCQILREEFHELNSIEIVESDFEHFTTREKFDSILAATAWHWPDPKTKYQHAAELLKPEGCLVVFRNYYGLENDRPVSLISDNNTSKLISEIDELYKKYGGTAVDEANGTQADRIEARHMEMRESMLFEVVFEETTTWHKSVDAVGYINLLRSFQDATYFGETFFEEMKSIIDSNGGTIVERIIADLIIARRVT
jgi:SAM-dependent methyltransferase